MLRLTRRAGETIRVIAPDGTHIDFKHLGQKSPTQVHVGVNAPEDYRIIRIDREGEIETKFKVK